MTIPTNQPCVISATVTFTITAAAGDRPLFADGERIERIRVTTAVGGPSQVSYLTASGREVTSIATR